MARRSDGGELSSQLPPEPAKADIRVPKKHALADRIKGISIGSKVSANVTGRVTSASLDGYYGPGGGASVCIELDGVEFGKTPRDDEQDSMTTDMKRTRQDRRQAGDADEEEAY